MAQALTPEVLLGLSDRHSDKIWNPDLSSFAMPLLDGDLESSEKPPSRKPVSTDTRCPPLGKLLRVNYPWDSEELRNA
ncbi:hypothetical protein E5288_WYG012362 [Bos mutus]|uniref:Uncharacterized protein n=1 Tax=Bos mutus TaxID=72004 RepID=A0A6B0RPW5_9CETA|nr:hypothetical protein [Bos mutus]